MDNSAAQFLSQGLERLGLALPAEAQARLLAYTAELLKWNKKLNLTAITDPQEVVDKHLLDSLAVVPEVNTATHILDLGAGAGLPGIPLAVALPQLRVTLVDAVAKKVAFMKSGALKAGVADRAKAMHARAQGHPQQEGIPQVDLVISRAFMDTADFLTLARPYLHAGGRVVTLLGQTPTEENLRDLAKTRGYALVTRRILTLPLSGDPRGVAVFVRAE